VDTFQRPSEHETNVKHTIHDVARRARVSITTVSRAINSPALVEPETAKRVWKAIEELKYYPNSQARSLVSGRSRILGLIVSDITNPFFPELVQGFEDVVVQHGYDILVSSTNYDSGRMALCVRRMLERKVEGVAIMTSEMDESLIELLARRNVPTVFLDVVTPRPHVSNVVVDYTTGIQQAVDHLVGLNHRRIGFISGPLGLKSAQIRRTAFMDCMIRYGIIEDESLVRVGDHKVQGGVSAMNELLALPEHPTAVLASNDLTAVGMISAIRRAGLSVPDDISVVGFDDIWLAEFTEPPLTTVRLSRKLVAEQACKALLSELDPSLGEPVQDEYLVPTQLIVRESTCKV
jgi:LacI family transcriptional regulator